jgi:uncharacterized protein YhdP
MLNAAGKVSCAPAGWRAAFGVLAAAAALFAVTALTYQLALARIPAHRATLENLVRARTGLDVRFDELGVRWGWYGPEAVFTRVELREPGEPNVLVRAAELTVGVDAWRTVQSGQLEAGRITLVAPDIDITRLELRPHGTARSAAAPAPWRARPLLARWPNGRLDIQGGTLRLPDPDGSGGSLSVPIRRATLHRADELWSANAQALLPERFGHELKVSLQLRADARAPASIGGVLHVEGERLVLGSWRELLARAWPGAEYLPAHGVGRFVADVRVRAGRLEGAQGVAHAQDVTLRLPADGRARRELHLQDVRATWHLERSDHTWHLSAEDLALGGRAAGRSRGVLALDVAEDGARIHARLGYIPFESQLADVAAGAQIRLEVLRGTLHEVSLDWDAARAVGERLKLAASIADLAADRAGGAVLEGARAHLSATDTRLAAEIASARGALTLSGILVPTARASGPRLSLRATLTDADVATLQQLLGSEAQRLLGPRAAHLSSGTITRAEFDWTGTPDAAVLERASRGSATLRGAVLEGLQNWPTMSGVEARLDWRGSLWRASVQQGRAGPFQLLGLNATWRTDGGGLRCSGRADARLESVLEWLRAEPRLDGSLRAGRDLAASGHALFAIDALVPRGGATRQAPRLRITTQLDGASILLASQVPSLENVHGTLTIDSGHLQRSTLTGAWLGGPIALRIGERRTNAGTELVVQAQGALDAHRLAAVAATDLGTLEVAGRTPWRGDLSVTPASDASPLSWHAQAETALVGIASGLPAPLAKQPAVSAPLHVEIDGAADDARVRVNLSDTVRGVFALRQAANGWRPVGGELSFGPPADAESMPSGRIDVLGHLRRVDLAPWIIAWRGFTASAMTLPLRTHLSVDELLLAGHLYRDVAVAASGDDHGLELTLDGAALAGRLKWPAQSQPESIVEARFGSLQVPSFGAAVDVAALIAALGPVAQLEIQRVIQQGEVLGSLSARLELKDRDLSIDPLTLKSASDELQATLSCGASLPCRLRFALDTRDAAATLRDFGLRADLDAQRGSLAGELDWPLASSQSSPRQWLTSLSGRVRLALSDGVAQAAGRGPGSPFALVAVPELLRDPRTSFSAAEPQEASHELKFARVDAEFDVRDGNAYTSDLHFDGDAEILMSGRIGLVDEDYDYGALILRGENRLPAAVRRFGAAPKLASAWMALRELVGESDADPSSLKLRLQGTWQAPAITAAR